MTFTEKLKDGLKDASLDQKKTHPFWKKVRNVSGLISGLCFSLLGVISDLKINAIMLAAGLLFGWIAGESFIDNMDKNKKTIILRMIKKLLTKNK